MTVGLGIVSTPNNVLMEIPNSSSLLRQGIPVSDQLALLCVPHDILFY